jgi:alanyl-tRNA synthetase
MSKEEAEKIGALAFFKEKYPQRVKVYFIGPEDAAISKEFCGGPHVESTGAIGKIKILKEESVGKGARRIRATVI